MTAKPIGTFARNCFLLIFVLWLAVFCFASGSSVESVFEKESVACQAHCRAQLENRLQSINGWFDALRRKVHSAIVSIPTTDETFAPIEAEIRNGVQTTVFNRLHAVQELIHLVSLRLEVFKCVFGLITLLAIATVIDAASLRSIAHHTFDASRPAVSFTSALGFLGALTLGAALVLLPFTGATAAGLSVIAIGCTGLHTWVRYFHKL